MDHDEVRDLLADAAIEPGGLERLMAGDTPTAAVVAGHLAGCPECADELERLHRSVGVIRPIVRAVPPPELRERTLAYVATLGRPRALTVPAAEYASGSPATGPAPAVVAPRRFAARLPLLAGLAAALVVAVTGTALIVNNNRDVQLRREAATVQALGDVATWTIRLDAEPDVRRVRLASAGGGPTSGTLAFSPSSTEVVVVAQQLTPAPAGHEYRCWVEVSGQRASVGKMYFGGDVAYWVGDVPEVAGLPAGARFGVSLVDLATSSQVGQPVLTGAG